MSRFRCSVKLLTGAALLAAMIFSTGCSSMSGPLFGRNMFQNKSNASNQYVSSEMYESDYVVEDGPSRPMSNTVNYQRPVRTATSGSC
jgi:hypothetical protein